MNKPKEFSDEELAARNKKLQELQRAFEQCDQIFYLGYGVLLGAVREGDFIRWDPDVEVFVKTEEIYLEINKVIESLNRHNFEINMDESDFSYEDFKIVCHNNGDRFAICGWYEDGNYRKRRYLRLPSRFFEGSEQIRFKNEDYYCMHPPEEYLKFQYDDWKTPTRSSNSDEYFNNDAFVAPWRYKMRKRARKLIIRLKRVIVDPKRAINELSTKFSR